MYENQHQPAGWYRSFCGTTRKVHWFPEIAAGCLNYVTSLCSPDIIVYKGAWSEARDRSLGRCKRCEKLLNHSPSLEPGNAAP